MLALKVLNARVRIVGGRNDLELDDDVYVFGTDLPPEKNKTNTIQFAKDGDETVSRSDRPIKIEISQVIESYCS